MLNIDWNAIIMLTIILKLLPSIPTIVSEVEAEAKELASTDAGAVKVADAIAAVEAVLAALKTAVE